MNEFHRKAQHIVDELYSLSKNEKLSAKDLGRIVSNVMGEFCNIYPSEIKGECCEIAMFVSLTSSAYIKNKKDHLTCRQALEKLVQHMQGDCENYSQAAVLLVDSWDPAAVGEWQANLLQIATRKHLEIYLISNGRLSPIQL